MKKEFKSDNILDYKTYKEFYDTFNFKFIKLVNLLVISICLLLLIIDGYKEVILSIILLLIFNIIMSLKAKIVYKKNFIDKKLINIHNEVFINEKEVILQADNGNKNVTLLNEVIEIYETSNLLVLRTNNKSNGGCIINKVNLKVGTLNELKQHLLSNCQNIKKLLKLINYYNNKYMKVTKVAFFKRDDIYRIIPQKEKVFYQTPSSGERIYEGATIRLYLEN